MRYLRLLPLLLVATAPPIAAQAPRPALTFMVPMRDGVKLATDIYLPDEKATSLPTILIRTPYDRKRYNREYGSWARWGYAIALQDLRGRFDSEGKAMAFLTDGWGETQDGYDTVEWLAHQEFSNGKVGTVGASAMGITQMLMAPARPPSLACQYILVATASNYHHASYVGGAFRKVLVEEWLKGNKFHPDSLKRVYEHPLYDQEWAPLDTMAVADRVNVPAIHVGGWFDVFCQGTIDGFVSRQTRGDEGARGRQKLLMGPWTHGGWRKAKYGDFELPEAARSVPFGFSPRLWFDHHLKGDANGAAELPTVAYYVMGPLDGTPSSGNVWRRAEAWPVPSTATPFYLTADGTLVEGQNSTASASRTFRYDPAQPTPTIGGRNLNVEAGPKDQRSLEKRADVLVFTTAPLEQDLEVTGRVKAQLTLSSNRRDTDVMVRLCDVYPDDRSVLIADGALRLATRNGFTKVDLLTPDEPVDVEVDLWSTSHVFAAGHRLRVSVSSANFPRYEANPNTGVYPRGGGTILVADNTLLTGGKHSSRLTLPVARRGDALDRWRYDEVQFKAAHNSIDRDESLREQLAWNPAQPHQSGCRGVELDIVQDPARTGADDHWIFAVQHGGKFDPKSRTLRDCLREVRAWADDNPAHHVVTIHIDVKNGATLGEDADFIRKIDEIFAAELDRERIYFPGLLQRDAPSLLEGVARHGWPTLNELRGQFIICFSGSDSDPAVRRRRTAYAGTQPRRRLAFVDLDQRVMGRDGNDECDIDNPLYNEGGRAFVNIQLGRKDWRRLARGARRKGFISRQWKANSDSSWREALTAGVHVMSTDRIRGHEWARVGSQPFARLPAASPSDGETR